MFLEPGEKKANQNNLVAQRDLVVRRVLRSAVRGTRGGAMNGSRSNSQNSSTRFHYALWEPLNRTRFPWTSHWLVVG
jgi:hypothetical protein